MYKQLPIFQRIGSSAYKADLSNALTILSYLGQPQNAFKSVHVAGTNGKGSISIILSEVFRKNNYKVGLYTSPHFKDFRERIRTNGKKIPKEKVVRFVRENREKWKEIEPSFFEITLAMAFDHFRNEQVDIAIVEVGLGGRLDSTNVITPELSIISKVGLDHQEFLGDTIDQIAREKGGIIKKGIPVILGKNDPSVRIVIKEIARQKESEYIEIDQVEESNLALPQYQEENLTTVNAAIEKLRFMGWKLEEETTHKAIEKTFIKGKLTGRWQWLSKEPKILADAAHNVDGLKLLFEELSKLSFDHLHIVYGMVKDKDLDSILSLFPKNAHYYFCKADIPRGMPAEELSRFAEKSGLTGKEYQSVKKAMKAARKAADKGDLILITGSIFVIAEII